MSMKTPMGLLGSSRRAREVEMRWLMISRACSCPMTRCPSRVGSFSTVSISSFIILPAGMPVHADAHQRIFALERFELFLELREFGAQLLGGRRRLRRSRRRGTRRGGGILASYGASRRAGRDVEIGRAH